LTAQQAAGGKDRRETGLDDISLHSDVAETVVTVVTAVGGGRAGNLER